MKRPLLIAAVAVTAGAIAAAPAIAGLAGNPSFSQQIPVRIPSQAQLVQAADEQPSKTPSGGHVVSTPTTTEPGDDRGRGTAHPEPGDDRGRGTSHPEPGDDRSAGRHGSGRSGGGSGRTGGSDDRGGSGHSGGNDDSGGGRGSDG